MAVTDGESQDTLPILQDSLLRRMRTMHSLYYMAVDTMGPEHVNHFERAGVLPIAFSLFHFTNLEDGTFMALSGGTPPIWSDEWQAEVQMAINNHGKELTPDEMGRQRIGDFEAFKRYQREVFERTESHLASWTPPTSNGSSSPRPIRQQWPALTAPCALGRRASRSSTGSSAGTINTGCATWERSSSHELWSASAA